jgi:hypothetical protein
MPLLLPSKEIPLESIFNLKKCFVVLKRQEKQNQIKMLNIIFNEIFVHIFHVLKLNKNYLRWFQIFAKQELWWGKGIKRGFFWCFSACWLWNKFIVIHLLICVKDFKNKLLGNVYIYRKNKKFLKKFYKHIKKL